ncbi:MAG: NADH-quinone oxidoreductase subunit NuoN [Pseudomonadota bacterium]|nr:NADH-quinone oxidoreductase subunit NuoN [Pseudomonadota bacterium]
MTGQIGNLAAIVPEMFLAAMAMYLLVFGAIRDPSANRATWIAAVVTLAIAGAFLWFVPQPTEAVLGGLVRVDSFARFMKILVLGALVTALLMGMSYNAREGLDRFEHPVLILLSGIGMLIAISARDLLLLVLGLELMSLPLYVLVVQRRDQPRSIEAGLKYFALGALSTVLMLYGISLLYGLAGATSYPDLARAVAIAGADHPGLVMAFLFVLTGFAFKLAAVPFHMWAPDVYEGAPTSVTALLALAPKITAFASLLALLLGPFASVAELWRGAATVLAVLSMTIGTFGALMQVDIKRLMGYSVIAHIGFAMVGLTAGSEAGLTGVILYLAIHAVMTAGAFAVILAMRQGGLMVSRISDLSGLAQTRPWMALAMAAFMFSLAGIPPLAGFFARFYVFAPAIEAGMVWLAAVAIVLSMVGAFYYLRIVKLMYLDEPIGVFEPRPGKGLGLVLLAATGAVILFVLALEPVLCEAERAAAALIAG